MADREHSTEHSGWGLRTGFLIMAAAVALACGPAGEERQDAAAPATSELESSLPPVAAAPERGPMAGAEGSQTLDLEEIAGIYQVEGVTVQANRGRERKVSGTIALQAQGAGYTASIKLQTIYPTDTGDIPAQIEGTGSGRPVGDRLVGTAETKMLAGAGVLLSGEGGAPEEELIVVSSTVATIEEDGSLSIHIQNEPGPGQDYSPSITVLTGVRQGLAGSLPPGSAGPEAA